MTDDTGKFEIDEDLAFQRWEWRVQRIGWWALAAFVMAAALGLFGGGPLSHAQAGGDDAPFRVEYERFVRVGALTRMSLHGRIPAGSAPDDWQLRINRTYFDGIRVQQMVPEATGMEIGADDVILRFSTEGLDAGPFTIILDVEPLRGGRQRAIMRASDGTVVTFSQLAYF